MSSLLGSTIGVASLLSLMYFYMYHRMTSMNRRVVAKTYKPNIVLSIFEVVGFLTIYVSCALLVTLPELDLLAVIVVSLVAFMSSILVFNISLFDKFGKKLFYVGTAVMTGYYFLISLTV